MFDEKTYQMTPLARYLAPVWQNLNGQQIDGLWRGKLTNFSMLRCTSVDDHRVIIIQAPCVTWMTNAINIRIRLNRACFN